MASFRYPNFTRAVAMCLPLLLPLTAAAQNVTSLSLAPSLVFGGDTSVGTVRLNKIASGTGFTVNLASSQSLAKVPATVVVPAGKQTASFDITTVPVSANTSASISAAGGGSSASYTLTIKVPVPKTVTFTPSRIAGGTSGTGTVTLTQVAAAATICNLKSDSALVKVPASVTIPAGSNSVNFSVTTSRTTDIVNANVTAARGSVSVTGILPVLPIGLDLTSPWAKFHGDAQNTGYSPNGVASPDWSATIGSPVLSSPAIGLDGTIYVGANNGYLYALKATDGSVLWKYKTGGRVVSSPVVTKTGVVFVGSADKSVYAINGTNGAKLWSYKTGGAVTSSPCIGADGSLYVGSYDGYLYALDQTSGSKLWSYQTGGPVLSSPNLSGLGILYVGSNDNCLYAIDTLSRTKLWSYATGGDVQSSPALANGNVYFGSFDGNVYALSQTTGVKVWNFQTDWVVYSSPCVDSAGNVFVGSDDASIYSLNGATGALNWSYLTDDCVGSSPAVDLGGNLYVGSDDGNLYCLNASAGSLVQAALQTGSVESSPATTAGAAIAGVNSIQGVAVKRTLGLSFPFLVLDTADGQWRLPLTPNALPTRIRAIVSNISNYSIFNPQDGRLYWTELNGRGGRSLWSGDVYGGKPTLVYGDLAEYCLIRGFVSADRVVLQDASSNLILLDLGSKTTRTITGCPYDEFGVAGPIPGTSSFYHSGQWSGGGPSYISKTDWLTGVTTLVGSVPNATDPSFDADAGSIISNYAATAGLPSTNIVRMLPDGSGAKYIAGSKSQAWNSLFSPSRKQISFLSAEATGNVDVLTCNTDGSNRQVINSLVGGFRQVAWLDKWQVDPHPGYTYNPANGHWYKAVSVPAGISWTTAEKAAEAEGGHLATITNQAENDFVFGLVNDAKYWVFQPAANNSPGPWLGGYTLTPGSSGWKWVTNEPWSFTIWSANNPSGGGETKLEYFNWGNSRSSQWNDATDQAQPIISYIIEIDGYHPNTP